MIYPNTKFYKDWKGWADAFVKVLSAPSGGNTIPVKPPQYPTADLPTASEDGMFVFDTTTKLLVYSKAGAWYRVHDNGAV